ncbi:MAG: substrate-binding domain-containing protein [Thermoleophilaceae bacterium]|jgi:ABC-type sugar transport system substrate-binding protein
MPGRCSCLAGSAFLSVLLAGAAIGCGGGGSDSASPARKGQVAAVIKGLDNPFFKTMDQGLLAGARKYSVPLRVSAAAGLQDTAGQASTLESLVAQEADCYLVNPISSANLIPSLAHIPKRTPIVNIDSPVDGAAARAAGVRIRTYIGTDNVAAGELAADAMADLVRPGAAVAVITGIPGDATSGARTNGFEKGARGRFSVVRTVAADFDRRRAELAAEDLLRTDLRLRGLFAVNDEMALGAAEAVRASGRQGNVAVIGLDGIREALEAVQRGAVSATVAQYPYAIGQLGVEACVAAVRGKSLPARIDAPVQLITGANAGRALARFPEPVAAFDDPLAALLKP